MFLSTKEMESVARSIARGVSQKKLIDQFEKQLLEDPDTDVSGYTSQELRGKLSVEISRANPNSPRYAKKYEEVQEIVRDSMEAEFAGYAVEMRETLLSELREDISMLSESGKAFATASGGEFGDIEAVTTPQEAQSMMTTALKINEQKYRCMLLYERITSRLGGIDEGLDKLGG